MRPERLHVTEHLALRDRLPVRDGRNDVPVAEGAAAGADDRQRTAALDVHRARLHRVDRRPVLRRDVDSEMKGPRLAGDPRVVEIAAHGMHLVERLHRPAIAGHTPKSDMPPASGVAVELQCVSRSRVEWPEQWSRTTTRSVRMPSLPRIRRTRPSALGEVVARTEQQPAELNHGVGGMLDFVFVPGLGIFEGLLDAFAAGVVLPPVVGTADAVVLDEAIIKRRAAMRTALADKTIRTTPIAV